MNVQCRKQLMAACVCALLTLAGGGCDEVQPVSPETAAKIQAAPTQEADVQGRLAAMWAESEALSYEVIRGTVDPVIGGRISGTVPSWPGHEFSIEFAPGVLEGTGPRTFAMLIPQQNAARNVYYRFEEIGAADGAVKFRGSAVVTIHWPAGRERPDSWFNLSCLNRTDENGDGAWEYSRTDERTYEQRDARSSKLVFRLPHFSRWSAQNGKNGTP